MTTPRDPLSAALRDALEAEPHADDAAVLARAIERATTSLAAMPKAQSNERTVAPRSAPSGNAPSPSMSALSTGLSADDGSAGSKPQRRPRRHVLRVAFPLAAAFLAAVAMAGVYVSPSHPAEAPAGTGESPASASGEGRMQTSSSMPAETAAELPAGPSVSVNDLPSTKYLAVATPDGVLSPSPPAIRPVAAAELFREANAERRAGNIAEAVDLYLTLQTRFPDASETQASHVTLGRLLLDRQGDASGALEQFDAYLKSASVDGTLSEEARLGRALAFQRLARNDDERRAWEELMARHPQSLHVSRARERLSTLGVPEEGAP